MTIYRLRYYILLLVYTITSLLILKGSSTSPSKIALICEPFTIELEEKPPEPTIKISLGTIVVDAGHGGYDSGIVKSGLIEKDINLLISKKLKAKLQNNGYTVLMTRNDDTPLYKPSNIVAKEERRDLDGRIVYAKENNAMLFVSIHVDNLVEDPNRSGAVVYYYPKLPMSKSYAISIQKALNAIEINNKPRVKNFIEIENFYVIKNSEMPSILIEVGYITNDEDFEFLQQEEFWDKIAQRIADGIWKIEK